MCLLLKATWWAAFSKKIYALQPPSAIAEMKIFFTSLVRPTISSLAFVLLFTAVSCRAQQSSVEIAFTGDIMMHYAVKGTAQRHDPEKKSRYTVEGFSYLFAKTAPVLSAADFAVGNMEFPVSPPFIQNEFIFNCPPQVIPALKKSGFAVVSLANNHMMDQKMRGALDTITYLEENSIQYFGAGRSEKIAREGIVIEKNGIRTGLLAYAGLMNYDFPPKSAPFYVNDLKLAEIREDIAQIRKRCDFVVVQPHTGVEYTLSPTDDQKILYKEILEAGADIVIGHHPHTLQSVEQLTLKDGRRAEIFYSLGNFICNQDYTYQVPGTKERLDIRDSIIVKLHLERKDGKIVHSVRLIPIHTVHTLFKVKGSSYKDIQTVVITDELKTLKDDLAKAKDKSKISAQIMYYQSRLSAIKKTLLGKSELKEVVVEGE
jgi:poly-gamma-glutamate capsule biosynthesis protein CapA/YwtB (metallophosphatase superfamily)